MDASEDTCFTKVWRPHKKPLMADVERIDFLWSEVPSLEGTF